VDLDEQKTPEGRVGAGIPGGPVLLRTKVRPPPARTGLIQRSRLDGRLDAGVRGRLCLVDAPAGSGKTTLLAQ
jgi:LuxR family transcriptional regulator, maltose regulon positive regulatory protein